MHPLMAPSPLSSVERADVELRLPADGVYASVLRTTAAGLAARMDFTIDDIEDLRIAVAEASALVLAQAETGGDLVAGFFLGVGTLTIQVEATAGPGREADQDSFAWQVLDTLAEGVSASSSEGSFRVRFTMTSQLRTNTAGAEL